MTTAEKIAALAKLASELNLQIVACYREDIPALVVHDAATRETTPLDFEWGSPANAFPSENIK